ncbi:MAG TPA: efflux RND transporter periplasmic adaptor subunit [Bryobacteraceae bacterium]|jgi:RND family efflux transporter MFP subunit|nr:efflux RND transporter periplasmic adaptor subunit [Bryobacteraceae bacterium]
MIAETPPASTRPQARAGRRSLLVFFALIAVLVGAAVVGGILPRLTRQKALLAAAETQNGQRPLVEVATARLAPLRSTLDLPGDLQALVDSPIFARVDGYLRTRLVDYGDRVKAGQLLAEIDTPELDQQLRQARATLSQMQSALNEVKADLDLSKANLNMARLTVERWRRLAKGGVVARQEADQKEADFAVNEAQVAKAQASIATTEETVHANEANVHRLEEMKAFARILAPYDGVITSRTVDIGWLINSGNGGAARELFHIAQIQVLRIFVNVPQTNVASIQPGQTAELRVEELPGQVFSARVTRIANALDSNSRAMVTVLEVPNPSGVLMPGMYAQVRFSTGRAEPAILVPGDVLILGRQGPRVAVVAPDHRIHLRAIRIGQDLGSEIAVVSGLAAGEMVVANPSDAVRENALVDVRNVGK